MKEERIADLVRGAVAIGPLIPGLQDIVTTPMTDSEGEDAISVLLVVSEPVLSGLTGAEALDLLYEIQKRLQAEGEDRFAFVQYATPEDLEDEMRERESGEEA